MRSGERESERAAKSYTVVFICTANRARSAFAAALLRRYLDESPVVVESVGTLERRDAPALAEAVEAARVFGIDLSRHRARALAPGSLADVDLVLGFEGFHVAAAVVTGAAARSRAFLLTELADSLKEVAAAEPPAAGLGRLVARADAGRGQVDRLPAPIADPVGGSVKRFRTTFEEIDRLVAVIATRLFRARHESPR